MFSYLIGLWRYAPRQCVFCLSVCSSAGYTHNQWQRHYAPRDLCKHAPDEMYTFRNVEWNLCRGQTGPFEPAEFGLPMWLNGVDGITGDGFTYICHACAPRIGAGYQYSCFKCKKPYFGPHRLRPCGVRLHTRGEPVAFVWCVECVDAVVEISSDSD